MSPALPDEPARDLLPAALLAAAEHDVRSLLTTVQAGAETLELHATDGSMAEVARIVADAGRRLSATLGELVEAAADVVRDDPREDLVDLVALLDALLEARGASPCEVVDDRPLHVVGSDVLLRHLLSNVVVAAVGPSAAAGVRVSVWRDPGKVAVVEVEGVPGPEVAPPPSTEDTVPSEGSTAASVVEVLSAAGNIRHEVEVIDGVRRVRLRVPNVIAHPSTAAPMPGIPRDLPDNVADLTTRLP